METTKVLESVDKPSIVARFFRVNPKLHGEFAIKTKTHSYWVRLWYGMVVDGPPVIREAGVFRLSYKVLLDVIKRREGDYDLSILTR